MNQARPCRPYCGAWFPLCVSPSRAERATWADGHASHLGRRRIGASEAHVDKKAHARLEHRLARPCDAAAPAAAARAFCGGKGGHRRPACATAANDSRHTPPIHPANGRCAGTRHRERDNYEIYQWVLHSPARLGPAALGGTNGRRAAAARLPRGPRRTRPRRITARQGGAAARVAPMRTCTHQVCLYTSHTVYLCACASVCLCTRSHTCTTPPPARRPRSLASYPDPRRPTPENLCYQGGASAQTARQWPNAAVGWALPSEGGASCDRHTRTHTHVHTRAAAANSGGRVALEPAAIRARGPPAPRPRAPGRHAGEALAGRGLPGGGGALPPTGQGGACWAESGHCFWSRTSIHMIRESPGRALPNLGLLRKQ